MSVKGFQRSSGSPEVDANLDSIGDGNRSNFLHLASGALEIDVSLVNSHLPVIPSLGALTARRPSAANAKMLVGKPDRSRDLDSLCLGVSNELVGDLLDSIQSIAAEGNSGSLELGILNALFLGILVSHLSGGNNINYL